MSNFAAAHMFRSKALGLPPQMDETVGFPESGRSLPIKIGRIDIPAVLQEASMQLHHKGRVGFYCGGAVLCCAVLCCAVLCCAVLCCAVLCCAVLCCAQSASLGTASSLHTVYALCCIRCWLDTSPVLCVCGCAYFVPVILYVNLGNAGIFGKTRTQGHFLIWVLL